MSLYETNYLLLNQLIPDLSQLPHHCVSSVSRGEDLFLQLVDYSRYTSSIKLTHRFQESGELIHAPGLTVRIYFDAHQAEVLKWQAKGDFSGLDPLKFSRLPSVKAKWQVNLFLGKWLRYCINIGHRFEQVDLAGETKQAVALMDATHSL